MSPPAVSVGVAVPIRSFDGAKSRLAPVMSPDERSAAARRWATVVLAAASDHACFVITDDAEVAAWAELSGATVVGVGGPGLDAAARAGRREIAAAGLDWAVIAHGDLPRATDLGEVIPLRGEVVLVPDRHRDGTTIVAVPSNLDFDFAYGPGSYARHLRAARAAGCAVRTVEGTALSFDVDEPGDLAALS